VRGRRPSSPSAPHRRVVSPSWSQILPRTSRCRSRFPPPPLPSPLSSVLVFYCSVLQLLDKLIL
jgi:hypothetical protein